MVNLETLYLRKPNLQYQNFQHTPNLIALSLEDPVNYKHLELGHLTKLQVLGIETENAECTLLRKGYIQQLISGLENLQEIYLSGRLYMPRSEQDYESVNRQIQTEVLRASNSPLKRDNIRIDINLYDPDDYQGEIPPCSEGH